ncbi:uncharacterized protein K489DRAFT_384842 [Dissoconium aciculare CBS 342.82]|uniref:Uncharacterized protein n=1 Tax=Dissoconium aciculare CBS 342.82 TaxID=1314786 RepID=A0A6J3LRF2_9PEZI|nr:uncharacterized protein K489DRAFT_384842 [Dissoconium aciculare CBS 342.82]KAF1818415.1 hypothetical protein K489DRAFT_384842 [Dissoconium aciculare CBS 342.82]
MPITMQISRHNPVKWKLDMQKAEFQLFEHCTKNDPKFNETAHVWYGSLLPGDLEDVQNHISCSALGFADEMYTSITWSHIYHHKLALRPDEVWFTILSQLGFYVATNVGRLGNLFKVPGAKGNDHMEWNDPTPMAERLINMLQGTIIDPNLRDWITPTFSTTNEHDAVIASMLVCGRLYEDGHTNFRASQQAPIRIPQPWDFGIPSVTLRGEKGDWELLYDRVSKLDAFLAGEPVEFANGLEPILRRFVESFTMPTPEAVRDFWSDMIGVHEDDGDGWVVFSGWITAFSFWNAKGQRIEKRRQNPYVLDEVPYGRMHTQQRSSAHASLPVTFHFKDTTHRREHYTPAIFFAGPAAIRVTGRKDRIEPVSAWWLVEKVKDEGAAWDMNE